MPFYQKRPVIIEAVQLNWKTWGDMCNFLGNIISRDNPGRNVETYSATCGEEGPTYLELTIPTLEGDMIARHGDFVIRGTKGEFYPCKPEIFAECYELVEEEDK